jgi:hypothetical protein
MSKLQKVRTCSQPCREQFPFDVSNGWVNFKKAKEMNALGLCASCGGNLEKKHYNRDKAIKDVQEGGE